MSRVTYLIPLSTESFLTLDFAMLSALIVVFLRATKQDSTRCILNSHRADECSLAARDRFLKKQRDGKILAHRWDRYRRVFSDDFDDITCTKYTYIVNALSQQISQQSIIVFNIPVSRIYNILIKSARGVENRGKMSECRGERNSIFRACRNYDKL